MYVCQASSRVNTPPPIATKLIVAQKATESQELLGGISSWAAVGSSGRLPCRVRAAPKPTFMWTTQDGMKLQTGEKYTLLEPKLLDQLVLWSSVLEIHHVGREDYGVYTCTADNGLGSVSITRTLNPPARPHPPTNFSVINVTSTSVTLSWTPNFGGGMPQGYTLRYREAGTSQYQVVDISGGETVGTTLSNLQPNTAYDFTIQAKNEQGLSAYVSPPITATMQEITGEASTVMGVSWRVPRLMVLIITLSGAALLVLNISIITCFLKRRNSTRNASASSSKSAALDAYGITPASTPGANQCDALLSLTTMSSTNFSNTTLPQKDDDHINEDDCDQTSLVILTTSLHSHPPSPMSLYVTQQNGDIITMAEAPMNNFETNFDCNFGEELQQPIEQATLQENLMVSGGTTDPNSTSNCNGASKCTREGCQHPEVTSLCSSIYDALPCESQHESCRNPSPYRAEDQVSMTSYQSDSTRTYPRSFSCSLHNGSGIYQQSSEAQPLMPHGPYHQPPQPYENHGYHPLAQSQPQELYTYHQLQQQPQQQQALHATTMPCTTMAPTTIYSEGANYFETRCSHSFSAGTSVGYATLGSRFRRVPSAEAAGQYQQLPHHEFPKQEEECKQKATFNTAGTGSSFYDQQQRFRRSSFHGQVFRASGGGISEGGKLSGGTLHRQEFPRAGSCLVHKNDRLSKSGSNLAHCPQHDGSGLRVTFASPEVSTSFADTPENEGNGELPKTISSSGVTPPVIQTQLGTDDNIAL